MKAPLIGLTILLLCSLCNALAEPVKPAKRLAVLTYSQGKRLDIQNQARSETETDQRVVAAFTTQLCHYFFQRGYDIVICVPSGTSHAGSGPPIYLDPDIRGNLALAEGTLNLFTQLESVVGTEHWHEFALNKRDLSRVGQTAGADIVCVTRVAGLRYTLAKRALERGIDVSATLGVMLLTYYSQSGGDVFRVIRAIWQTGERLEAHLVCAVSTTGDTVWRQAVSFQQNPIKVARGSSRVYNKVLQRFPRSDELVVPNLKSE